MDVERVDGLARGLAHVHADVVAVGAVLALDLLPDPGDGAEDLPLLLGGGVEPARHAARGDDEGMARGDWEGVPEGEDPLPPEEDPLVGRRAEAAGSVRQISWAYPGREPRTLLGGRPDSPSPRLHDREGTRDALTVLGNEVNQELGLGLRGGSGHAHEDHPVVGLPPPVDHLPEILVPRDQGCLMLPAERENLGVGDARLHFGDIPDRVPQGPEPGGDLPLHSLVAEESQAASVGAG